MNKNEREKQRWKVVKKVILRENNTRKRKKGERTVTKTQTEDASI